MCDAVVGPCKPLNVTWTRRVCAARLRSTCVEPVPGELLGGLSAGPLRLAVYEIGAASADFMGPNETKSATASDDPSSNSAISIQPVGLEEPSSSLRMDAPPY